MLEETTRRITTRRGHTMVVDTRDTLITPHLVRDGFWERYVEEVVCRLLKPGQTAVEVGANLGYHTLAMAQTLGPAGKLYTFEANPELIELVHASLKANRLADRVVVHYCAVADRCGPISFDYSPKTNGGGHVKVGPLGAEEQRITVPGVTLDEALQDAPAIDLLRMDIEGSEMPALRGALGLIDRSPTLIIVTEWCPVMMQHFGSVENLVATLAERGFRVWDIERTTSRLVPISTGDLLGLQHSDVVFCRQSVQ